VNLIQICTKCGKKLKYVEPNHTFYHCGTDFWTQRGERRWKPKICMVCRSDIGRKAQKAQALSYSEIHSKPEKRIEDG
jgi:ribosomal protein L40E